MSQEQDPTAIDQHQRVREVFEKAVGSGYSFEGDWRALEAVRSTISSLVFTYMLDHPDRVLVQSGDELKEVESQDLSIQDLELDLAKRLARVLTHTIHALGIHKPEPGELSQFVLLWPLAIEQLATPLARERWWVHVTYQTPEPDEPPTPRRKRASKKKKS